MRWIHRKADELTNNCDDAGLHAMLWGQLDARREKQLTKHLEKCGQCQRTITELAAAPSSWSEAMEALEISVDDQHTSDEADFDVAAEHLPIEQELISWGVIEPSESGDLVGKLGRYDLRKVLGFGGTGVVFKAFDRDLGRVVAVKILAPALSVNGPARRRFAREAQAAAAVVDENVVAVHHVESSGKCPYIVMQYIDGESLQDMVMRDGPVDINAALRLTMQVADALHSSHAQGLIHRDIKPANLMIGRSGQRAWVTDFGLARAVDDASLTRTGFIAGTPHYMSPEQARGEVVGPQSDLFSLGGTLFFMLTGRAPFRADRTLAILNRICNERHRPIQDVNGQVPVELAKLVDHLLAKSSADRPASAAFVRDECKRLLELHSAGRLPISKSPNRWFVTRGILLAAAACVCAVALVAGWQLYKQQSTKSVIRLDRSNISADRNSGRTLSPSRSFAEPYDVEMRAFEDSPFATRTFTPDAAAGGLTLPATTGEPAVPTRTPPIAFASPPQAAPQPATTDVEESVWVNDVEAFENQLRELERMPTLSPAYQTNPTNDRGRSAIEQLEADLHALESS